MIEPLTEEFYVKIEDESDRDSGGAGKRKKPSSNKQGKDTKNKSQLDLPNIIEIQKEEWHKHSFTKESALKVMDSGEDGYDFFVNMDNIHLLTEKKGNVSIDTRLLDARYKFGLVLLGIALLENDISDKKKNEIEDENKFENSIYDRIFYLTKAISPMLLPMISGLGELNESEIENLYEDK